MDSMLLLDVISRWLHVGTAIVVVGGTTFMRLVLMPAAEALPTEVHDQLRSRIMAKWRLVVMIGIVLFLLSGGYNYWRAIDQYKLGGLYHGLLGIKILLALAIFFLASALVGRSAGLEWIRHDSRKWMAVLLLLAAVVVAIGGFLKVRPKELKRAPATESASVHSGQMKTGHRDQNPAPFENRG